MAKTTCLITFNWHIRDCTFDFSLLTLTIIFSDNILWAFSVCSSFSVSREASSTGVSSHVVCHNLTRNFTHLTFELHVLQTYSSWSNEVWMPKYCWLGYSVFKKFSLISYAAFCCIHDIRDRDLLWFSFWMSCRHQELRLLEMSFRTYVTIEFIFLVNYATLFRTLLLSNTLQKVPQQSII